jgi:hypothetical protein
MQTRGEVGLQTMELTCIKLEGEKTAQLVTEFMEEAEKRILKLEATAFERLMAADETLMATEGDDVEGLARGGDGGWAL